MARHVDISKDLSECAIWPKEPQVRLTFRARIRPRRNKEPSMSRLSATFLVCALVVCGEAPAAAAPTECPDKFAGGIAPQVVNPKLLQRTQPLCFSAFAILHSGAARTALWSAEHLTRERLRSARETARVNAFHAEARLPHSDRAELSDYTKSGLDRGHLSPSGDMPDQSPRRKVSASPTWSRRTPPSIAACGKGSRAPCVRSHPATANCMLSQVRSF